MLPVVELAVDNTADAMEYYESLLAVNPENKASNGSTLAGDHLRVHLKKSAAPAPADTTLNVTGGMLARVLDAAMKAQCTIAIDAPEQVKITDRFGHRWTLRCRIA